MEGPKLGGILNDMPTVSVSTNKNSMYHDTQLVSEGASAQNLWLSEEVRYLPPQP